MLVFYEFSLYCGEVGRASSLGTEHMLCDLSSPPLYFYFETTRRRGFFVA